jgi:hypothetical protein
MVNRGRGHRALFTAILLATGGAAPGGCDDGDGRGEVVVEPARPDAYSDGGGGPGGSPGAGGAQTQYDGSAPDSFDSGTAAIDDAAEVSPGVDGACGDPPEAGAPAAEPAPFPGIDGCFAAKGRPLCARAGCASMHSACCAFTGDCCEGGDETMVTRLNPDGCRRSFGECLPKSMPFGPLVPRVADGGIVPGGTGQSDGGFIVAAPLDTITEIEFGARMGFVPALCQGRCDETMTLALLRTAKPVARNVPVVGLTISGATGRRILVIEGVNVWEEPLDPGVQVYRMVLRPSGELELFVGARSAAIKQLGDGQRRSLFLALYGRQGAKDAPVAPDMPAGRVEDAFALTRSCGAYQAWSAPVAFWPGVTDFRAPSLAAGPNRVGLAVERDQHLYVVEAATFDALAASPPKEADRITFADLAAATDPELVAGDTAPWAVFFVGLAPCGGRWIGVTQRELPGKYTSPRIVLRPEDVGADDLDSPSVLTRGDGVLSLMVRRRHGASVDLALVQMPDPIAASPAQIPITLEAILAVPTVPGGIDADGLGTADVINIEDTTQIVFGGQRATATSVGVQVAQGIHRFSPKRRLLGPEMPALAEGVFDPDIASANGRLILLFTMGTSEPSATGEPRHPRIGFTTRAITTTP